MVVSFHYERAISSALFEWFLYLSGGYLCKYVHHTYWFALLMLI